MPVPEYVRSFKGSERAGSPYMSQNGILFRFIVNGTEAYTVDYLSSQYMECEAVQRLAYQFDNEKWAEFLNDLYFTMMEDGNYSGALHALQTYNAAMDYMDTVSSQTPESVKNLAKRLTADCKTDAEKAIALQEYLVSGEFKYSLTFTRPNDYNVETFLFNYKTGVCYDFAGAYMELCRAVGLPARNVQGYMMADHFYRSYGDNNSFVITTEHGHAWTEVYIAGYGWIAIDSTAPSDEAGTGTGIRSTVIANLQYSGLGLLAVLIVVLFMVFVVIPFIREKLFRSRFQKQRNAEAVQAAMKRLLKQWDADPTQTARDICKQQEPFLGINLSDLLNGFERTVYGGQCDAETADRVFRNYCEAYDAYRAAVKREKAARRAERKAQKAAKAQKATN
jgi:hypothetical protein